MSEAPHLGFASPARPNVPMPAPGPNSPAMPGAEAWSPGSPSAALAMSMFSMPGRTPSTEPALATPAPGGFSAPSPGLGPASPGPSASTLRGAALHPGFGEPDDLFPPTPSRPGSGVSATGPGVASPAADVLTPTAPAVAAQGDVIPGDAVGALCRALRHEVLPRLAGRSVAVQSTDPLVALAVRTALAAPAGGASESGPEPHSRPASGALEGLTVEDHVAIGALSRMLIHSAREGQGNSCLVTGSSASGKTRVIEYALAALRLACRAGFDPNRLSECLEGPEGAAPRLVRLSGLAAVDERAALFDIARQLSAEDALAARLEQAPARAHAAGPGDISDEEDDEEAAGSGGRRSSREAASAGRRLDVADALNAVLATLRVGAGAGPSGPVATPAGGGATPPVVFVLDHVEYLVSGRHGRQALLYSLLELTIALTERPVLLVAATSQSDVLESLEKRVRSRFSNTLIRVDPPHPAERLADMLFIHGHWGPDPAGALGAWNAQVERLAARLDWALEEVVGDARDLTRAAANLVAAGLAELQEAARRPEPPGPVAIGPLLSPEELRRQCRRQAHARSTPARLQDLSVLQLALLVASFRLPFYTTATHSAGAAHKIRGGRGAAGSLSSSDGALLAGSTLSGEPWPVFNFDMVHHTYTQFALRQTSHHTDVYSRPVCQKAFADLVALELVIPAVGASGNVVNSGAAGSMMVRSAISEADLQAAIRTRPECPVMLRLFAGV
ncbi:hypothetical protein H696_04264 [Fonticula alba]|uniref:Uncharacterized protein n=1 Tax=Fonticula alba TaxID=691883 RepID=A0A058Z3X9_FONAL|nr:hypothetical protein H696_04264 [Fonticula alba]KCV68846.1 hypothetical protein H696_04264 [Fonticula alba]|eukprot:XP_009496417.1 hypothetical protein H696_04264 [Fonticula alba]